MAVLGNSHLHHKPHFGLFLLIFIWIILCSSGRTSAQAQGDPEKILYIQENVEPPALIGSLTLAGVSEVIVLQEDEPLDERPGSLKYSDVFDFQLDGDVTALRKLDREERSVYKLIVIPQSNHAAYSVDIVVQDVNDNAPKFREPVRNLTVSEIVAVDDRLALLGSALDPDEGDNSTQRYEIVGGPEGVFRLEQRSVCKFFCLSNN